MKLYFLITYFFLSVIFVARISAEPYIPENDSIVLYDFSQSYISEEIQKIQQLKANLKQTPDDHQIAYALAKNYIEQAKATADPRYYGLAEAVINPWWDDERYPEIMLLKARILEFDHRFQKALNVLDKLLKKRNAVTAMLMRANIYQVIGEYDKAKQDCQKLLFRTSALVAASCLISVSGFTSTPEQVNRLIMRIRKFLNHETDVSLKVRLWTIGLLSEVASLNQYWELAEELMLMGLNGKPEDGYLLSLYADLLLKQNRYVECIKLLQPYKQQTALLVRLLAAENRLSDVSRSSGLQQELELRIREDMIKGDERHLREYAYYQLYVQKNYREAFQNALINWKNQKELIDSLLLYAAATYLNEQPTLNILAEWREKNHVQIDFSAQSLKI